MEKELLSIVMMLKEYRSMLLGADLHVHTDNKNLTFENLTSQHVLGWRCYVEEYSPKMYFVKGPENVLADAYSRIPCAESMVGKNMPIRNKVVDEHYLDSFYSILDESELLHFFLNLPELNTPSENPLNMELIRERQQADPVLLDRAIYQQDLREWNTSFMLCKARGQSRHAMENCSYKRHDSSNHKMVSSSVRSSWTKTNATNTSSQLLPSGLTWRS
jgi:hypothetical protein